MANLNSNYSQFPRSFHIPYSQPNNYAIAQGSKEQKTDACRQQYLQMAGSRNTRFKNTLCKYITVYPGCYRQNCRFAHPDPIVEHTIGGKTYAFHPDGTDAPDLVRDTSNASTTTERIERNLNRLLSD